MTYVNSEYNYDNEVPKAYAYLFQGLLIYLIRSSLLCVFTHTCIVLFSSNAYNMVNSALSSQTLIIN